MAAAVLDNLVRVQPLPPVEAPAAGQGPPGLSFATDKIQPPAQYWVTPDDLLVVGIANARAGVNVAIQCRLWTPEGKLSNPNFMVQPPNDRVLRYTAVPLYYGFLVSVAAFATGTPLPVRGQTYVTIQVVRPPLTSFVNVLSMGADYIEGANFVQWPYARIVGATESPGALFQLYGTTPGAGSDWSLTVPTGARWRVRLIFATLVTGGAAGTRVVQLQLTTAGQGLALISCPNSQGPTSNLGYTFAPNLVLTVAAGFNPCVYLPPDLVMPAGSTINAITNGLQAGDQWTAPSFYLEEVLEQ